MPVRSVDRITHLAKPYDFDAAVALVIDGAAHLRQVCTDQGLVVEP